MKIPLSNIQGQIFYIVEYTPYRIHGQKNPNFSRTSGAILDLKEEKDTPRINQVANRCAELLVEKLVEIIDCDEEICICFVPSSNIRKKKLGLRKVIRAIQGHLNVNPKSDILIRKHDIPKLSSGGNRCMETHLESIEVNKNFDLEGKIVVVIDDVTTSGNSLLACERLLYSAGASVVVLIACGKTV